MSSINVTWERVIDADGTIYCCWFFNIHNCKDEETYQIIALTSGILCTILFLINSFFITWRYLNKKIAGNKGYLITLILDDLAAIFGISLLFSLYFDAIPKADGFLVFALTFIFITLAGASFAIQILELTPEIPIHEPLMSSKLRTFQAYVVIACVIGTILGGIFSYFVNIGSPLTEVLFETTFGFAASAYFLFLVIYSWQVFKLFKKMGSMATSNINEIGKKQIKLIKGLSIFVICATCWIFLSVVVFWAVEDLFKIYWLSVTLFVAIGIMLPFSSCLVIIRIYILESQKKALSNNQPLLQGSSDVYSNHLQSNHLTDFDL